MFCHYPTLLLATTTNSHPYLSVDNHSDPVDRVRSGHRQHGPEEDRDGKGQREDAGIEQGIQNHDKVAEEL